ncbi:cold shock and DUF1294 domain-containing protein [Acidovorax sp. sic0104]|uniref:DUF1294 domain-containing protein n=1 Tax=Acidovorax sp. sic0104 TaxID=2854784 RepID=UPI001C4679E6|nr:cold shock and DUF1294 domain-containing protein [Acidovorax sp. sic0104]MBV7540519.1 DUF1294 domain-containing protein [Acidovorax sp. sic0104]
MQKQGTVIRWDATRAFGFIRTPGTSADVFFHVRDFRGSSQPREGLAVVYEEIHVGGKGPRAMAVQPATGASPAFAGVSTASAAPSRSGANNAPRNHRSAPGRAPPPSPRKRRQGPQGRPAGRVRREARAGTASASLALALVAGWLILLGSGIWTRQLPLGWTLAAVLAINLVTFIAYAADKSAAIHGRWRTQESHLHMLSLAGGWPAAWLAQQAMRHKSSKQEFRAVYWLTVVVHCAVLAAWVARVGR